MTAFQIACPILALVAIGYVVRKSVRERQLCVEAAIVIGSAIAWWHDPLINWFQPALFYNAGLVNFGNWTQNIPGWLSPDGRLMAEPVLMIGMIYIWMPLAMGSLARWAMGRARHRWPALGPAPHLLRRLAHGLRHRVSARDLCGAPRSARLSGVDSGRHIVGGADRPDTAVRPHSVVVGAQFEWCTDVFPQP